MRSSARCRVLPPAPRSNPPPAAAPAPHPADCSSARMRQWLIGAYPASEILDNAYVMELYDVRALETRAEVTKSLFDTYTRMAYTRYEREELIINGISLAIVTFVAQYQARLVFSVPLRPALARIYDSLLKKHAHCVHYLYNQELVEEGLHVIEIPPVNGRIPPNSYEHKGTAPKRNASLPRRMG
ncbi:hypothetical protein AN664_0214125 [Serratia marcescens]|nr:hypothetical protein AN699_0214240 [Serratia marcescens]OCN21769.1 hypothetical protein AN701_0214095 [Serratia marcescens]OCN44358.1 hypothetical protein AN658_0213195 [Serratia marcescens]OCN44721.1 hypothetical protein AN660_0213575 [Serratia marcescens]OCN64107.1 hypothetical protein AN664_0214125 [Serratia marcescens]